MCGASEWGWSPDAVGAIATAAAVIVAVWVAYAPQRERRERLRMRSLVAHKLLEIESHRLKEVATHFSKTFAFESETSVSLAEHLVKLKCPNLKECLSMPESYPEATVLEMAEVYALSTVLSEGLMRAVLSSEQRQLGEKALASMLVQQEACKLLRAVESMNQHLLGTCE